MLELINVSVNFESSNSVLAAEDISISFEDGSRTAIVGETGSGKSVLLLAVIRLLPPNAVISGRIILDKEDLLKADKERMRQVRGGIISYVPQGGGASMNPLMKVGHQVGEPLTEHRGYTKKQAFTASVGLLRKFNLSDEERLAGAYPHSFSGGMRQRAMAAMGISAGAKIILADEPTKGLDDRRVKMVIETLNTLQKETLICVTHDMSFAKAVSRDTCVMYAAQQVEYGRTEQVMNDPLHPYTQDMIEAMPENSMIYDGSGFAPSHEDDSDGCRYRQRCRDCSSKCRETPPLADINGHKVRCWKYDFAN